MSLPETRRDLPDLEDFAAQLDSHFGVDLTDGTVYPLKLTEASAYARASAPAGFRAKPFQLKFRGPGPGYLPQQIHLLHHPALGSHEIFLVPIGQDADGFLYRAVFN
jgi:hypothetical protein